MKELILRYQNAIGHVIGVCVTALIIKLIPVWLPICLYYSTVAFVVWVLFELVQAEAAIRSDYVRSNSVAGRRAGYRQVSIFDCIMRYQWKTTIFKDILSKNVIGFTLSIIVLGTIFGWR